MFTADATVCHPSSWVAELLFNYGWSLAHQALYDRECQTAGVLTPNASSEDASTDSNNVRMPRPMPAKAMPYHNSTCGHIWASQRHWLEMIALLPRRRQQQPTFSHSTSQSCHRPPVSTHTCTRVHMHTQYISAVAAFCAITWQFHWYFTPTKCTILLLISGRKIRTILSSV